MSIALGHACARPKLFFVGGWDGTSKGSELPASDYWFRTIAMNRSDIGGHFTLKG